MKRRRSLLMVPVWMMAALFALGGPLPAAAADEMVILYDGANFDGSFGATFLLQSHPDLRQFATGWAGRISSLRVTAGISIAVYSEPNYGGTCETFVGRDPWLGNNRIGNDRIASIRFFHNCLGRVVDPVVIDMTAVTGASDAIQCPVGYVKREMDLNKDADGAFIYLCLLYQSKATAGDNAIATVTVIEGFTSLVNCGTAGTGAGGTRVDTDLNAGADGFFVYLCYWTRGSDHPNPVVAQGSSLRDLEFVNYSGFPSASTVLSMCRGALEDVDTGLIDGDLVDVVSGNLNSNIPGADVISPCSLNYEFALAQPPDVTLPVTTFVGRTPDPNAAGWHSTNVTLTWSCSHSQGVVNAFVTQTLTAEGANQSAEGTCEDLLDGNTSSDRRTGIHIDKTPPSITLTQRSPANPNGWNQGGVDLNWTCADALSGPLHPVVGAILIAQAANQRATGTCEDLAGNSASDTQTGINIDSTPPEIFFHARTPPNIHGWNRTDVEATWTCSDTLSGVVAPFVAAVVTGEGSTLSATGTCRDRADNSWSHTITGIQIDRTAPLVNVTGVTNGGVYALGSVPSAGCSTEDGLSGVEMPAALSLTGGSADAVGTFTATCSGARDRAGNQQVNVEAVYQVQYPFAGFLAGAVVRHAPVLNGRSVVQGSVRMMLPETVRFNGAVTLTGDLLIPGSPTIVLNGHPSYGGTIDGGGEAMPMDHSVILNGGASLRHVLQRTDGLALPHAAPPPSPLGTRNVVLNDDGDDPGSFSTIHDLTLNGNAGPIAVPAGTYGTFTANGNSRFVLGVAGSTVPAVYNLQGLRLNGRSSVEIAGPVILTVQDAVVLNGSMGAAANPGWLLLRIADGGLTLNGGVAVHGFVTAPAGTVTINGNSSLTGGVAADRLLISGNGRLNLLQ